MKLIRPFIIILLVLLFSQSAYSQNCDDWEEWIDIVKTEYPELLSSSQRMNSQIVFKIASNLYSDHYFVPYRGKSFLKESLKSKTKTWRKIQTCYTKNRGSINPMVSWVFQNIHYRYHLSDGQNPLINQVQKVNTEQQKIDAITKRLNNENLTYDQLQVIGQEIENSSKILFLSRIQNVSQLYRNKEAIAAAISLKSLISNIDPSANSKTALYTSENFITNHRILFNKVNDEQKLELKDLLSVKVAMSLKLLMKKEMDRLDAMSIALNVKEINQHLNDFKRDYGKHFSEAQVIETMNKLKQAKTDKIIKMSTLIIPALNQAKDKKQLESLSSLFFTDVNNENPAIKVLKQTLDTRKEQIITIENERIAAINKKRQEQENIFKKEQIRRAASIEKMSREVALKRAVLSNKYGINLPKIEDLSNMLQPFMNLISRDKKYEIDEAANFFQLMQRYGFYRRKSGRLSNNEEFVNQSNIRIIAYATVKDQTAKVYLAMNDADKEIIDLYRMELAAGYRNRLKGTINPEKLPEPFEKYVFSGGTTYHFIGKEGSLFTLYASSNRNLRTMVIAPEIAPQKIQVKPFTNSTNIYVKKGDRVTINASGKMKLGAFLGSSTADGIDGYTIYNYVKNLKHGSLIGSIGDDNSWFNIGSNKTFIADRNGRLHLRVNDRLLIDNENYFTVSYKHDRVN